jgi:hypothetical protein
MNTAFAPQRLNAPRSRIFVVIFLSAMGALHSCQRPPFSDKINGEWTGSTSDKHHSITLSVKNGRIDELRLGLDFEPEKTGAMALMKCGYSVTLQPNSPVSNRTFTVDGNARGMIFGLAGQKTEQGTTAINLRGTFTAEDAAEGELTVTLDSVADCGRFNGSHVFHWTARREGISRDRLQ